MILENHAVLNAATVKRVAEGVKIMDGEEKLLWMFKQVHGEITKNCSTKIQFDEDQEPKAIHVMKDNQLCWTTTKLDLVFDYLTKHLK